MDNDDCEILEGYKVGLLLLDVHLQDEKSDWSLSVGLSKIFTFSLKI